MEHEHLIELIRTIPDFPKPGILYRDITTLLKDKDGLRLAVDAMAKSFKSVEIDVVAGVEARGFILGAPIAIALDCGFVPVRKEGKLPGDVISENYQLEYGEATIEVHRDAVSKTDRVLVIDDVLATGGTMEATCGLLENIGATISGICILVELSILAGRRRLEPHRIESIIRYND